MKIVEDTYAIDIYPYINEEDDDTFAGRITVHRNSPVLNGLITVSSGGNWLSREQVEQLIAGLQKAVELSREVEPRATQ